jgi:hypothetical protein
MRYQIRYVRLVLQGTVHCLHTYTYLEYRQEAKSIGKSMCWCARNADAINNCKICAMFIVLPSAELRNPLILQECFLVKLWELELHKTLFKFCCLNYNLIVINKTYILPRLGPLFKLFVTQSNRSSAWKRYSHVTVRRSVSNLQCSSWCIQCPATDQIFGEWQHSLPCPRYIFKG